MRNPIRLKNLRLRFVPLYALGAAALLWAQPGRADFGFGAALVVAGGALRSWGAGHLVKSDVLAVSGPYAHLRHPLYAGTLLVGTGFSVMAGGWLAPLLLAALLTWFLLDYLPRKERSEAARLAALHGAAYAAYRAAVPPLWPTLSAWRPDPDIDEALASDRRWSLERWSDNNELGTALALLAGLALFAFRITIQP